MKVLTIHQPYAELIKTGVKKYEIRSRKTNYRGELYIHSGVAKIGNDSYKKSLLNLLSNNDLVYGSILFKCNLTDCTYIDKEFLVKMNTNSKIKYNDDCLGSYAWTVSEVEELAEPISTKGQLGIWNYQAKN